MYKNKYSN